MTETISGDSDVLLRVTFTDPAVASEGMTEE